MKVISLNEVPSSAVKMEGVKNAFKQVPISEKDGSPTFALRVFTIKPGGFTPYHQHPYEHLNYVIKGRGFIVNEKEELQNIKEGDFILVMPDEKHQYRNASDNEDFMMICGVPKEFEK